MLDDGDTMLHLAGGGLVVAVVVGLVVVGLLFSAPSDDGTPEASWEITQVNDSTVRVTHDGGDSIRTENLRVTVDGFQRAANWSDPVSEGDSAVIFASAGNNVRVVWNGGRGDRTIMASERI